MNAATASAATVAMSNTLRISNLLLEVSPTVKDAYPKRVAARPPAANDTNGSLRTTRSTDKCGGGSGDKIGWCEPLLHKARTP